MAPAVTRSSSQSKISDSFRSSAKAAKPLKQVKPAVKPIAKRKPSPVESEEEDGKHLTHLIPNNPKLVSAARTIEANRKAPFGITLRREPLMISTS
jgi:hypothetical protein